MAVTCTLVYPPNWTTFKRSKQLDCCLGAYHNGQKNIGHNTYAGCKAFLATLKLKQLKVGFLEVAEQEISKQATNLCHSHTVQEKLKLWCSNSTEMCFSLLLLRYRKSQQFLRTIIVLSYLKGIKRYWVHGISVEISIGNKHSTLWHTGKCV